jgi:anti-sigma B factor antagonist
MKHQVKTDGENVIISISGDVDLEFSGDLRTVLMENLPKGRTIIVDMSGVELIDSSGIASLLEAFQNARKKGKDFIIASVNTPVIRVFNLARLETVFDIEESVESALSR